MNLLEETLQDIEKRGYATGDVLYVGGEDGRVQMTWEEAEPILKVNYDDGYGSPGLWKDRDGCIWVVDNDVEYAKCIREEGGIWATDCIDCEIDSKSMRELAPFTKLTLGER